jgi:hypothetical protein
MSAPPSVAPSGASCRESWDEACEIGVAAAAHDGIAQMSRRLGAGPATIGFRPRRANMTPQAVASIELTSVPPPPAGDPEYQPPDPAPPPFPDPTEPQPTPTEPELPPLQPPPERDRPSATSVSQA